MVVLRSRKTVKNDGSKTAAASDNKKSQVDHKRKFQEGIPEETKRGIVLLVPPDEAKKVFEFADLPRPAPSKELLHLDFRIDEHPEAIENPPSKKVKVPEYSGIENCIKTSKEAEKTNTEFSHAEEDKENVNRPSTPTSKSNTSKASATRKDSRAGWAHQDRTRFPKPRYQAI